MTGLEIWIKGTVFGLGAAIPIGPVNVELARRGLKRGFAAAVCLGMGAVTIDVIYACLAVTLTDLSRVGSSPWTFWPLASASVVLLGYLAIGSLRAAYAAHQTARLTGTWELSDTSRDDSLLRTYLTGLAMTSINPMTLVFWFVSLPGQAVAQGIAGRGLAFLALGVFTGTVAWVLFFSGLLACLGRWRKPWWIVLADVIGGVVLLGFAILGLTAMLNRLVS
jgi:L-lysine exporter family protein LysE/ArgO